jgi:hypothetical protein
MSSFLTTIDYKILAKIAALSAQYSLCPWRNEFMDANYLEL